MRGCGYGTTSHTVYIQGIVVRLLEGAVDFHVVDIMPAPPPPACYYMGNGVCLTRG
jgi:hypothetical protein